VEGRRAAVLAAAGVSVVATFAAATLPQVQLASRRPPLHVALETAASLIALLAGSLVFGRLLRQGRFNELILACALAVFALINIFLLTVPSLLESFTNDLTVWALLVGRSLGAALFAFAAFAPRRRLRRPGLVLASWVAVGSAAVLLAAALVNVFAGHLARSLVATPGPDSSPWHELGGPSLLLTLQLALAVLYGVATVGFLRRSRRLDDEFFGWLAIAAVFASFSHLNYFLYPSPYLQGVHIGDVFRLCSYVILLVGSMREIWSYWHALSEVAVLEERRRIARDLHDGLAQELAYLARNLDSLEGEPPEERDETLGRLREAIARAQLESRRAVSILAASRPEPVDVALEEAAAVVAERLHLGLELDLVPGIRISAARQDALVRIACEAITNAARHSGASQVNLKLERDGSRLRLRVSDHGSGFDTTVASGFGLVSMRERARSVGGELRISSDPGGGSVVEAAL
jgi:signal transduction histidine kinase